ncbi:conserved hypothetical protein [Agrobacterium fabacearum TT111]|nr:hypothetical protein AGROH133_06561 [Agrobacterium tumefaciens]CUW91274.1 conserved hypothetical protein [Agrobacterium fabacearum TT111]
MPPFVTEMGAAQDFYNPDALPVRSEQRMNAPFSAVSGLIYINTRHRETEMPLTSLSPRRNENAGLYDRLFGHRIIRSRVSFPRMRPVAGFLNAR